MRPAGLPGHVLAAPAGVPPAGSAAAASHPPPHAQAQAGELPPPASRRAWWWRHPAFMHYNRLVAAVWLLNLVVLGCALWRWHWWADGQVRLQPLVDMAALNLGIAVLARQQRVINALFWLATRAPLHWPLWLRWNLGKVFHFGGLHSGCALAATAWFALFTVNQALQLARGAPGASAGVAACSAAALWLLLLIVATAQPAVRRRWHNGFELVHRFVGWAALLLLWLQSLLFINDQRGGLPYADALWRATGFWLLLAVTLLVALPWLRLRRIAVEVQTPSRHAAIVSLRHGARAFPGSSTALSLSPLAEWHAFANIPMPGTHDYRIIVSRSGDWTGRFIDEKPRHVWVKGIITAGVANIETLFRKVLYVATGSGIGPVLPHLIGRRVPTRLVWATRSPRKTYGDALVDEILASQPDAQIVDTDLTGKPDLLRLAWQAWQGSGCEAVIVIANQQATEQLVQEFECRGVPAFGAIWDS